MSTNLYPKMLTDYMASNELNQNELAARLGVRPPTLSNWLNGGHGITAKNRAKIEQLCAVVATEHDFLRRKENELILWYLDLPVSMERRAELLLEAARSYSVKDEVAK